MNMGNQMKVSNVFENKYVQELIKAAEKGDLNEVNSLQAVGVDINTQGKEGVTPLLWLLLQQDKRGFETLLKAGADPNVNPTKTQNVIVVAAAIEDSDYLELLFKHDANPNIIAVRDQTPLMKAANNGRIKNMALLLKYGADINQQVFDGTTALLSAATQDEYEAVLYLLEKGADFNVSRNTGGTLAYLVHSSNLKQGTKLYDAKEKVRRFLMERGISFPPESPLEVRKRLKLLEFAE
jgi:ankyrin repeat protein